MTYAEVLLPLPLGNTFTYTVPEEMAGAVCLYGRVVAPFGKKRHCAGIVVEIHDRKPEQGYEIKELSPSPTDGKPVIREYQLQLWRWMSGYYL
ncbi:MAG: primosomal protein N', partial [Tannerella sp.]|nr:primosomal protein N' [Tannerella sp.]